MTLVDHRKIIKTEHRNGNIETHAALSKGVSTEELSCSCFGHVTQKNDIMTTPEENRLWEQKKRDKRRIMGGFKNCNRGNNSQ